MSKKRTRNNHKRKPGAQPGNQNARKHGYYSQHLTAEELEALSLEAQDTALADEIALQRVLNNRLLKAMAEATPDELLRIAHLLTVSTGRIARLLRDQRALSGEAADGLLQALQKGAEEILTELGYFK